MRLNIAKRSIDYFDTVEADQNPGNKHLEKSCDWAVHLMAAARRREDLAVFQEYNCRRKPTYHRSDGKNREPVSWAHVEAALDRFNAPPYVDNLRPHADPQSIINRNSFLSNTDSLLTSINEPSFDHYTSDARDRSKFTKPFDFPHCIFSSTQTFSCFRNSP